MIAITTARIRSIVADCRTEKDIEVSLRKHKIRFTYTTETGYTSIKVPCRKGSIRIYRTASRTSPFTVRSSSPTEPLRLWPAYY